MSYSTTELLASIKRRCLIPTSQITYQDTDLLAFADEELQLNIVPMLMRVREDYLVGTLDYSIVAGQNNYAIPTRAIGTKVRDVVYVDTANNVQNLTRMSLDEVPYYYNSGQTGVPTNFYFQNNDLILFPTPSNSEGTLRVFYFQRPGNLVASGSYGVIAGLDTVLNTVTVAAVPTSFAVGVSCDFVKAKSGFNTLSIDKAITNIASTVISFGSLPTGLAVGDYVCLAEQSAVPALPLELHYVLAQRVAVKVLEGIGDQNNLPTAQAKLEEMEKNMMSLIANRVEGEATKIVAIGIGGYIARGL